MAFLRILVVSLLASIAACMAGSLILYGYVDRGSYIALPFALLGSILLLAPGYAALKERGIPIVGRYLLLIPLGAVAGTLMLGFISMGDVASVLVGGFYGATTAVLWIILHFISKRTLTAN